MSRCQTLPWLPRRNSVIRSEAARERAELGRQYYEHKQCGRKKMGNTVYIGSHSLLKKAYINCTCIYEVSPSPAPTLQQPASCPHRNSCWCPQTAAFE